MYTRLARFKRDHRSHYCAQNRGVSLIFALVTLVALSLAAVALVRSVNTSGLIVGNLGFKQDTIAYASNATEKAVDYLNANLTSGALNNDASAVGYYATAKTELDPADRRPSDASRIVVGWDSNKYSCATGYGSVFADCLNSFTSVASTNENKTNYIITRLCNNVGSATDPANSCARPVSASLTEGGEKGEINYNRPRGSNLTEGGPYYRIVVRSVGARNTVSYTETLVHF